MKRLPVLSVLAFALLIAPVPARAAADATPAPPGPGWQKRTVTTPGGNLLQVRAGEQRNAQGDQLRQRQFRVTDGEGNLLRRGGAVAGRSADGDAFRHQHQWRRAPQGGAAFGERTRGIGFGGRPFRGLRFSRP